MNLARLLLRNSLIIVGTTALLKIATTILFIVTYNSLPDLDIARLGAAFSWGFLLSATADLGNRLLLLREAPRYAAQSAGRVGEEGGSSGLEALLAKSFQVWLINGTLATLVLLPALKLSGYSWQLLGESAIFFAFGLLDARAWQFKYALRGLHAPWIEAKVTATGRSLFLGLGLLLWGTGHLTVATFGLCFVAGITLELLIFRSALKPAIARFALLPYSDADAGKSGETGPGETGAVSPAPPLALTMRQMYVRILPFGLAILFVTIAQRLPLILMPVMGVPLALAYLTTAIKLPEAAVFLPGNAVTAFLPTASLRRDHPKLRLQATQALEWMATIGVLAAGLLALEAVAIFDWIFKETLFPAVTSLPILAVWFGIIFVERCAGALNIALGGERFNMRAAAAALVAAVLGCGLLIVPYGAEGASITIMLAAVVQVSVMLVGLSQMGVGLSLRIILRPFLAAVTLMAGWYGAAYLLGFGYEAFFIRSAIAGLLGLGAPVLFSLFLGDEDIVRRLLRRQ